MMSEVFSSMSLFSTFIQMYLTFDMKMKNKSKFSCSVTSDSFETPWTIARWAPLSTELSREEYWSG